MRTAPRSKREHGTGRTCWRDTERFRSICPSIDLVLLSHGDLAHTGLFAFAHANWGLRAPVYSSIPVQSLGKVAASEEAESLRAEEDIDAAIDGAGAGAPPSPGAEGAGGQAPTKRWTGKRVATVKEVQAAFESINTLRYSQPTRLSGLFRYTAPCCSLF